jgi:hypothetical protein
MPKIFADTNKFLAFYQAATDPLEIFDELTKYRSSFVTTSLNFDEFYRNRVSVLIRLERDFDKTTRICKPLGTSLLNSRAAHNELVSLNEKYEKKAREVTKFITEIRDDIGKDPVAARVQALLGDASVVCHRVTDKIIPLAHQRKLLGNPPTSDDKWTIGDEVIWETLIDKMEDDLVIVSNDETFLRNCGVLMNEYRQKTGKQLLLITEHFREALKAIGEKPTKEFEEREEKMEKEHKEYIMTSGPIHMSGSGMASMGQPGSGAFLSGNIASMRICPACGASGYWINIYCDNCMRRNYPLDFQ